MRAYDEQARIKTKLFLYYSRIGTNSRVFDKMPYDRQEKQVVKAANILCELGKMDSLERARFIKSFIVQYGDIHKLNAKLLQASIVNDVDLVVELEKICKE